MLLFFINFFFSVKNAEMYFNKTKLIKKKYFLSLKKKSWIHFVFLYIQIKYKKNFVLFSNLKLLMKMAFIEFFHIFFYQKNKLENKAKEKIIFKFFFFFNSFWNVSRNWCSYMENNVFLFLLFLFLFLIFRGFCFFVSFWLIN